MSSEIILKHKAIKSILGKHGINKKDWYWANKIKIPFLISPSLNVPQIHFFSTNL
jgi:hypothetical protein